MKISDLLKHDKDEINALLREENYGCFEIFY